MPGVIMLNAYHHVYFGCRFGHVEFILKGPEFRHLREVDNDPQSFCPSKPGTLDVIREMIDQVAFTSTFVCYFDVNFIMSKLKVLFIR
jgi:hypothetical protein